MNYEILTGDCRETLKTLPAGSVHCVVTSPPYFGLRDYGHAGQIGLERSIDLYVGALVDVFAEIWRVLRADGTAFLNLGDSYFSGGRRAVACDTSDKEPEDYQDRDCLCESLCDVCRVVYQNRKFHNDSLLSAMLVASLSAPIRAHTESEIAHFPTSDLIHQANHNSSAIRDRWQAQDRAGERLRASLVSMFGELPPQLLDVCLLRANHGECLLCARSLADCAPGCERRTACPCGCGSSARGDQGLIESLESTLDIAKIGGSSGARTLGKVYDSAYPYYTIPHHHAQLKPKDLIGVPWRVAFALQDDGWYLRSDIIWHKPNPMPESVTDRPTKAHEYLFLLAKQERYFYDAPSIYEPLNTPLHAPGNKARYGEVMRNDFGTNRMDATWGNEAGRNRRSVWSVTTEPYSGAHFATMPTKLVEPAILAGTSAHGVCSACGAPWVRVVERGLTAHDGETETKYDSGGTAGRLAMLRQAARERGGEYVNGNKTIGWRPSCSHDAPVIPATVLDPFSGAGTVGVVAIRTGRRYIGCELNPAYVDLQHNRIRQTQPALIALGD